MNGYNFTERVRKVLAHAREEAFRLGHEFVGTEHFLLGILRNGDGVANAVLYNAGIDGDAMRRTIEDTVSRGIDPATAVRNDLPYTTRAKKTLELAMLESRELDHSYVGTEHLLLGLLREEQGIAASVLREAGLTLVWARENVLQILGSTPPGLSEEIIISHPPADAKTATGRAEKIGRMRPPESHGYNFSERVRRILVRAREEATRLQHEFVGTEHILLGLLGEGEGVAKVVLLQSGVDSIAMRGTVEAAVTRGTGRTSEAGPSLPYTTRAKKSIELAMAEANELGHNYIGTEHILLGLLREEQSIAANVLRDAGLTLDGVRQEVLSLLGHHPPGVIVEAAQVSWADFDQIHRDLISTLDLKPHREGGHYREVFRSGLRVTEGGRNRSALTTIYYLLNGGEVSRWHVVDSDEVWHFYYGGGLLLREYDPQSGRYTDTVLGDVHPIRHVHVIPAGHWQSAEAFNGPCLAGCTVAPGFEFEDFRMVRDIEGHLEAFTGVMSELRRLL